MDWKKVKSIIEEELQTISDKSQWDEKDAGRLIVNAALGKIVDATAPPEWDGKLDTIPSTIAATSKDPRTAHFTGNQCDTINRYIDVGQYTASMVDDTLYWQSRVLNILKDVELELRRPFTVILCRYVGYDDDAELIPLEITAGKAKGEYADAIVAEYIQKRQGYCHSVYDALLNPMCEILAWNILAPMMAEAYGLPVIEPMQRGEVICVRKHMRDVRDVLERLAQLCEPRRAEIMRLFDASKLLETFNRYNAVDGKRVNLRCEPRVSDLLKSYRIKDAAKIITEELENHARRDE